MPRPPLVRIVVFALGCAALAGCLGRDAKKEDPRYGNLRALNSTVDRPVQGTPAERTYWNPRYRDRAFRNVRVEAPAVLPEAALSPEHGRFLDEMRKALELAVPQALLESGRFGAVSAAFPVMGLPGTTEPVDLVCRVEALTHVNLAGQPIRPDAVFGDPSPKVIAVVTLEEPATGEVVFRYTQWEASTWEYGRWAMEDLPEQVVKIAVGLREGLAERP